MSGRGQGRQPPQAGARSASLEAGRSQVYLNTVAPRRANSSCHRHCRINGWSSSVELTSPPTAWHQQRVSGPHGFAVRSDLSQSSRRTMCCPPGFGRGVEAPFVYAPVDRSQDKPALRRQLRASAAASTASHPTFVTTAKRPSCRERTGRAGRTDLPDGEREIFFAGGLDRANHLKRFSKFAI